MASTISDTDLAKNLSDILDRIHAEGAQFIIERDGEPVATLAPLGVTAPITMRELAAQLRHLPPQVKGLPTIWSWCSAHSPLLTTQHGAVDRFERVHRPRAPRTTAR